MKVVHGCERRELAVAEAVAAMMTPGPLPVAALHTRAAALEQIGPRAGHRLEVLSPRGCQGIDRMIRSAQRFEELRAQRPQVGTGLGARAARGHALEVQGRNELVEFGQLAPGVMKPVECQPSV